MKQRSALWLRVVAVLLTIGVILLLRSQALVRFEPIFVTGEELAVRMLELPLEFPEEHVSAEVYLPVAAGGYPPRLFRFHVDDCLERLEINGRIFSGLVYPVCSFPREIEADLRDYIEPGLNEFKIRVGNSNGPGRLRVRVAPADFRYLAPRLVTLLLIGWLGVLLMGKVQPSLSGQLVGAVLLLGVLARVLYFFCTEPWMRAYDYDGHLDYIWHMGTHFSIPPAEGGWEFFQPPLYYFLAGLIRNCGYALERTPTEIVYDLQLFSLVLSLISLGLMFAIGRLSLSKLPKAEIGLVVYTTVIAFLPGLVFKATRLSNDVLHHTLALGVLYFLLRWWETKRDRDWYGAAVLGPLALLAKSSALVFGAIGGMLLLIRADLSWQKRFRLGALAIALALVVTGWYYKIRVVDLGESALIGNIAYINPELQVSTSPVSLFSFNPLGLLSEPFLGPFSVGTRHEYLLEFLFRSAFFGEFDFGPELIGLAAVLLFIGINALFFAFMGVSALFERRPGAVPMAIVFSLLLASLMAIRIVHPYSTQQDFRFIPEIVVPIGFFLSYGLSLCSRAWIGVGAYLVGAFALLTTVFLLMVYSQPLYFYG